jgi:hypothetical protein
MGYTNTEAKLRCRGCGCRDLRKIAEADLPDGRLRRKLECRDCGKTATTIIKPNT